MENPRAWTPTERAIAKAIDEFNDMQKKKIYGPSLVHYIYSELKGNGYLKDEPEMIRSLQ